MFDLVPSVIFNRVVLERLIRISSLKRWSPQTRDASKAVQPRLENLGYK